VSVSVVSHHILSDTRLKIFTVNDPISPVAEEELAVWLASLAHVFAAVLRVSEFLSFEKLAAF
jgi:hypothetical protein